MPPLQKLGEALWTPTETSTALAAERTARPRDDLMTALVQAEVDGERLTHAEIAAFFVLLAVAGNDTTRHTTSHAMRALTTNPDQRALLLEDLDGRLPIAVEEFVRWATPVLTFRRTTTRPVELHSVEIPAGEKVLLFYHSGNRDERAFEQPWRFDVTRDPNHHLGFGGGGRTTASAPRSRAPSCARCSASCCGRSRPGGRRTDAVPHPGFIHAVKRMPCSSVSQRLRSSGQWPWLVEIAPLRALAITVSVAVDADPVEDVEQRDGQPGADQAGRALPVAGGVDRDEDEPRPARPRPAARSG